MSWFDPLMNIGQYTHHLLLSWFEPLMHIGQYIHRMLLLRNEISILLAISFYYLLFFPARRVVISVNRFLSS